MVGCKILNKLLVIRINIVFSDKEMRSVLHYAHHFQDDHVELLHMMQRHEAGQQIDLMGFQA